MLLFATAMVVMPMSVKAADYDVAETETTEENDSPTVDVNGVITNVDALDEIDWDLSKVVGKTAKIQTSDEVEKTSDIEIKSMYNEYKRTNKYVLITTNDETSTLVRCYDSKKKLMWTDNLDSSYKRKECWNTCCYFEFYHYKLEACPEGSATDYKVVFAKPVKKWYVPEALTFTGKAKCRWNEKKMVATCTWNPVKGATKYEVYVRPHNRKENAKWYKVGTTSKNSIKVSKYRNDKLKKNINYEIKVVTCCGKYKCKTYDKCYIGVDER